MTTARRPAAATASDYAWPLGPSVGACLGGIPHTISYQGVLRGAKGTPAAATASDYAWPLGSDAEYSITARLPAAATASDYAWPLGPTLGSTPSVVADAEGKTVVWQGTYLTKVENSVFNLTLGSGEYPLPSLPAMDMPLWVSIQVGDEITASGPARADARHDLSPELRKFAPLSSVHA